MKKILELVSCRDNNDIEHYLQYRDLNRPLEKGNIEFVKEQDICLSHLIDLNDKKSLTSLNNIVQEDPQVYFFNKLKTFLSNKTYKDFFSLFKIETLSIVKRELDYQLIKNQEDNAELYSLLKEQLIKKLLSKLTHLEINVLGLSDNLLESVLSSDNSDSSSDDLSDRELLNTLLKNAYFPVGEIKSQEITRPHVGTHPMRIRNDLYDDMNTVYATIRYDKDVDIDVKPK